MTNPQTAAAATRQAPNLGRRYILLGIFSAHDTARALVRTDAGRTIMLETGSETEGLTLLSTGDGSATLRDARGLHRLVIA